MQTMIFKNGTFVISEKRTPEEVLTHLHEKLGGTSGAGSYLGDFQLMHKEGENSYMFNFPWFEDGEQIFVFLESESEDFIGAGLKARGRRNLDAKLVVETMIDKEYTQGRKLNQVEFDKRSIFDTPQGDVFLWLLHNKSPETWQVKIEDQEGAWFFSDKMEEQAAIACFDEVRIHLSEGGRLMDKLMRYFL